MIFDLGDRVRLFADFKDDAGVATNTTVVLKVRDPAGVTTTRTATPGATGHYEYLFNLTGADAQVGRWYYRFEGSGTVTAAEEGTFVVRSTQV